MPEEPSKPVSAADLAAKEVDPHRRAKAIAMAGAGLPYKQIAKELGYWGPQAVRNIVSANLDRVNELRAMSRRSAEISMALVLQGIGDVLGQKLLDHVQEYDTSQPLKPKDAIALYKTALDRNPETKKEQTVQHKISLDDETLKRLRAVEAEVNWKKGAIPVTGGEVKDGSGS